MKWFLRVLIALLVLMILVPAGWFAWLLTIRSARARQAMARGTLVTVAEDTTVITQPLRKDGYVNYLAALNNRAAEGVTPENNAAVPFWQAMGPSGIKPEMRSRYFQMLKMTPPPEKGDYYISFDEFLKKRRDAQDPHVLKLDEAGPEAESDYQRSAMRQPWSQEELPLVADWLAANEKPLALLVEASKRPRRFEPMLCGDSDEGKVFDASLGSFALSRDVGRALAAHAMLRLKLGKTDACWEDLLACHRFGRLTGQEPNTIQGLVAIAIDTMACEGDQAMLQHAPLTSAQAVKMRDDLAALPPLPNMVEKIDTSERFLFLDLVAGMARDGFDSMSGSPSESPVPKDAYVRATLDWDQILRMGNSWYDRMVVAGRKPARADREAEFVKIDKDLNEELKRHRDWMAMATTILFDKRSEQIGYIFISLMLPATRAAVNAQNRGEMQADLIRLGFALAAYRADHGSYPQKLGELTAQYIAKVPVDVFANDGPLHYALEGKGYLLYSVGPNGVDDGGRDREEGGKAGESWDDLPIRVK
jgi:hypothetical protein